MTPTEFGAQVALTWKVGPATLGLAPLRITVDPALVVIVPPPVLGTGVPLRGLPVAVAVFDNGILVEIIGLEEVIEAALAGKPPGRGIGVPL